jgi:signal transduction histidine kinase
MSRENLEKGNILIVDDTPTNLGVLFDYLTHCGFKVFIALDGESALEELDHTQPDLILLDVMMPGIDGFETCRRLKVNPLTQDIPVIFLTALSETVDKVQGFNIGAVDYITKPIHQEEVLSRVQTHLTIRNLQKKLAEKNAELAQLNQDLETLVATKTQQLINQEKTALIGRLTQGIVHNLRNPLQVILGFSNLIEVQATETSNKLLVEDIKRITKAAQQINQLMDNLMYKSKMEQSLELKPVDINKVVQNEIDFFNANHQFKHQVTKKYLFDENLTVLPLVYADISQIVDNLINNALDAMWGREEQILTIVTRQDTNWVYIDFQDNGCGIPAEALSKIFDPFYTSKPTKSEEIEPGKPTGTGLGLHTCAEILKHLGGKIVVTSEVDQGSIFTVVLPKVSESCKKIKKLIC